MKLIKGALDRMVAVQSRMSIAARFALLALVMIACGELTGPQSPSTPTDVTAKLASNTSATITWRPSPLNDGVISYSIYRNGTKVGESQTTTYTDAGLAQQTTYVYSIAANCKSGVISDRSVETAASTVTTVDVTPPTVVAVQPPANFVGVSSEATATATFSEPMNAATINAGTFTLRVTSGGAAIAGTVTYNATTRTAEFKPAQPLPNPVNITATITTGAKDLAGNSLAAPFVWAFTTRDDTPPRVTATSPASGATGVSPSVAPTVTFSEAMDASTINATNITLRLTSTGAPVAGIVTYNATTRVATFTPNSALAQTASFTLTVSAAVKDVAGNLMGTNFVATFSTGDTTPPAVLSVSPANGATSVPVGTTVRVTFSEPMDPATINTSTVTLRNTGTGVVIPASVGYDASTNAAVLTPNAALADNTNYTVSVTTGPKDVAGNSLAAPFVGAFTTRDDTPPRVTATSPASGATGVSPSVAPTVTFSEAMDASTINATNITLRLTSTGAPAAGSVTYNATTRVATFTPNSALAQTASYTLTVSSAVKDVAGNLMGTNFVATFSTGDTTPPTVLSVSPANGATSVPVGTTVRVTFSEPMDPATINASTVTLRNTATGVAIPSSVGYDPATNSAVLTPNAALAGNTNYTVTVTTGAKDVAGNALASAFSSAFTTVNVDSTPPTVIAVIPTSGSPAVSTGTTVQVTFSEAMDQSTITGANITLRNTATSAVVAATVTYNVATNTATLTPAGPLANGTNYTFAVSTGVKDLAGNALASQFTSTFTTVPVTDTTAPTVVSRTPASGATNVPTNTSVTVTFSEPMDPTTINTTTIRLALTPGGSPVAATVSYNAASNTATLVPSAALANDAMYIITVTTGVKDVAGNAMAAQFTSGFRTAPDTTSPTITQTSPANGAVNVPVGTVVAVTFSEPMDPATINGTTFTLRTTLTSTAVAGIVSYNLTTRIATFTPSAPLAPSTSYTATVTTGAKDLAGNGLTTQSSFVFVTAGP